MLLTSECWQLLGSGRGCPSLHLLGLWEGERWASPGWCFRRTPIFWSTSGFATSQQQRAHPVPREGSKGDMFIHFWAYDNCANSWILDRYEPCQAASSKTCPNFYAKKSQRITRASPRKSSHKTQSDSRKMPLVCTSFLHMSQPSPHVGPKTSQNCTSMEYRTGSCRLQTEAPCDNYFLGAGEALSHGLECFPGLYTSSLSLGLCGVAESIFSLTPWWQGQQRPWRSTLSFGRKSCLTWGDKPLMCKMSTKKNRDMTSQTYPPVN